MVIVHIHRSLFGIDKRHKKCKEYSQESKDVFTVY